MNYSHVISFHTEFPKAWSLTGYLVNDEAIFKSGEEDKAIRWIGEKKEVTVINPTLTFLEKKPHHVQIQVMLDQLPSPKLISHLQKLQVSVPSLAMAMALKRQGIQAKVFTPCIKASSTKSIETNLSISQGWLLWIDPRLVATKLHRSVFYMVLRLLQEHRHLHIVWVSSKKIYHHPQLSFILPQQADEEENWRKANFFLLLGEPTQSMVLAQLRLIEAGVIPISSDVGDHDEWVKHFYSGILIRRKRMLRELSHYISVFQKKPYLFSQIRQNGRRLIEEWVE